MLLRCNRSLLPLRVGWVSYCAVLLNERVSVTIESEPTKNSTDFDPISTLILETSPEKEFSSEHFTEMLLSYIFGPSVVKYGILSNNRYSKLHAVIDCLPFLVADITGKNVIFRITAVAMAPSGSGSGRLPEAENKARDYASLL